MGDPCYHDFYKIVMKTMRKGETAWVKFSKAYHRGIYHQARHYLVKSDEEKKILGSDVHIKFAVAKITRKPICEDPNTYRGRINYVDNIRKIGKDLFEDLEFSNA